MFEGQLVTPTLRLVRVLGGGGMGSVWVADHLALHTQVVVKFMDAKLAHSAGFVRRFQTEAIAAAAIKSPHVAQVFDHGITDEHEPYIVMELLQGEDLRERIKRGGPLDPAELAPILAQVAKALALAHHAGIIHRDIKPANVFLMQHGDELFVKVLDFGIAKLTDDGASGPATMTGDMLGTAHYMSPEALLGTHAVDFRSDLWALAVVAYKALTGATPFRGATFGAVSVAVNAGTFPLPSAARPGLSPAIDAWMLRALQREPSDRFASARAMAEAFEQAVREPHTTALAPSSATGVPSAPAASQRSALASDSLGSTALAGTARTAPIEPRATKRRAPLAIAALVLVGVAALLGFRMRARSGDAAKAPVSAEPVGETSKADVAPVASAQPPPRPTAAAGTGVDPNDLPSTSATSPVVGGRKRRAAPPASGGKPKGGEKAAASQAAPEAPPAEPPPTPEEDTAAQAQGACARCAK
jgi:serine/threonine-protein kinase